MNESTLNRMIREHKEHLIWLSVFLVLAVFVTALVFGTLRRSVQAQTYTKRVFVCASAQEGAEPVAHKHNDDCYENGELICTLPERELHIHGDECYADEKVLVCTLEEGEGHVHTDACYTEKPVLVCTLEESDGHVHSVENGCYTRVQGDLICTDEDPEHVHTDDCYAWEEVLTCEIPEGEGAHHHSEECYETQRVLSCSKEEGEGAHTHDDTCYEIQKVLICDKEEVKTEHVHTVDCFKVVDMSPEEIHAKRLSELPESDPTADVESPDIWESRFASVPLSGNWDKDLLKIAETQLGYTESQRNFDAVLDENGEGYTLKGWTRYGAWYGIPYGDWCAMFISFCLNYADIPESAIPYDCATTTWIDSLSARGMYVSAGSYDPKPGDLIFFDWEGDGLSDHVGIVWAVNENSITTIEGNHTISVELFDYDLSDSHIQGYGILPENPELAAVDAGDAEPADDVAAKTEDNNSEVADAEATGDTADSDSTDAADAAANADSAASDATAAEPPVNMPPFSYSERVAGMRVTIDADEGAFPEGTTVRIMAIEDDSIADQVAPAVSGQVVKVQAVDITFYDANGNEIEPLIPIRVTMRPFTQTEADNVDVVHVGNDGTVSAVETQNNVAQPDQGIAFSADSFSTYALVYTVNFEFDANGEIYRYSFAGGTTTSLRQLLLDSGMRREETVDGYLDQVVYVSFSNPEYMEVTQSGNDWLVKSIHAFDTAESLTITLSDGRMIGIPVTVTGIEELQLENAVISSSDGVFLPDDTEGHATVVEQPEAAIAAVEDHLIETGELESVPADSADVTVQSMVDNTTDEKTTYVSTPEDTVASDNETNGTGYQVFEIGLENVDTEEYTEGFSVSVTLPERIAGRNFRLYHIHDDMVEEIPVELKSVEREGTELVSGFSFTTTSFSEFVLRYTVDFTYVDGSGEVHAWSFPGRGEYELRSILKEIGVDAEVTDATLTLTEGNLVEGALYLNDTKTVLCSDVPFTDTYRLMIETEEKDYVFSVTDAQNDWTVTVNLLDYDGSSPAAVTTANTYGIVAIVKDTSTGNVVGYRPMGITLDNATTTTTISFGYNYRGLTTQTNGDGTTSFVDNWQWPNFDSTHVISGFRVFETSQTQNEDWWKDNFNWNGIIYGQFTDSVSGYEFLAAPNGNIVDTSSGTVTLNLKKSNEKQYAVRMYIEPAGLTITEDDQYYLLVTAQHATTGTAYFWTQITIDPDESEVEIPADEWFDQNNNPRNDKFTGNETITYGIYTTKKNENGIKPGFNDLNSLRSNQTKVTIIEGSTINRYNVYFGDERQEDTNDQTHMTTIYDSVFLTLPNGNISKGYIDQILDDATDFGYYTEEYSGHSGDIEATVGAAELSAKFGHDFGYSSANVNVNRLKVMKVYTNADGSPVSNKQVTIRLKQDERTTQEITGTTNANGYFEVEFTGLNSGSYDISEVIDGVEISANGEASVDGTNVSTNFSMTTAHFANNANLNYFGQILYDNDDDRWTALDKASRVDTVILTDTDKEVERLRSVKIDQNGVNRKSTNIDIFKNGTEGYKHYDIVSDMVRLRQLSDDLANAESSSTIRVINIRASEISEEGLNFDDDGRYIVLNITMDRDTFCPQIIIDGTRLVAQYDGAGRQDSSKVLFNLRSTDGGLYTGDVNTSKESAGIILAPSANAHILGGPFAGTIITQRVHREGNELHSSNPNQIQTLNAIITNVVGKSNTGSLELRKDFSDSSIKDKVTYFSFEVTLSNEDADKIQNKEFPASGLKKGNTVSFNADGKATVLVRAGNSVTISGLPEGTSYIIKEISTAETEHYQLDYYVNDEGTEIREESVSGLIEANDTSSVTAMNKRQGGAETVFRAKKTLKNGVLEPEQFTFTLTEYTDASFQTVRTGGVFQTKKNDADGEVLFDKLTFDLSQAVVDDDHPDHYYYYYVIKEEKGSPESDEIIYDETHYQVTVDVYDRGNGNLTVTRTIEPSVTLSGYDASFTNEKNQKIPINILKVDKQDYNSGKTTPLPNAEFCLTRLDEELPATENGTKPRKENVDAIDPVLTDANGNALFSEIEYGWYEVTETKGPAGYILTSDSTFYIKIDDSGVQLLDPDEGAPKNWQGKEIGSGNSNVLNFTFAEGDSPAMITVGNDRGTELPRTGGPGTALYTLLGGLMLVTAGAVLTLRKKKNKA